MQRLNVAATTSNNTYTDGFEPASAINPSLYVGAYPPAAAANQHPINNQWHEYMSDGGDENDVVDWPEQENWLPPRPLAPKPHRVAESELRALDNSSSVYFQL